MAVEPAGVERALGALGTTFRLTRLYPPGHPALREALRQVGEALPAVAALGSVEWKVGATGLHWRGQHLLPRNAQLAELAGLLYARGVRAVTFHPGATPDHLVALFRVATGTLPPDDPALGRIGLTLGRRSAARFERVRTPGPAPRPSAGPRPPGAAGGAGAVSLLDGVPLDILVRRALDALTTAATAPEQRAAVERLAEVAPALVARRDVAGVAGAIAVLDRWLGRAEDPALVAAIDRAALALSDRTLVERMVERLGEPEVPPAEREALVHAVGALAPLSLELVLAAFRRAPAELRAPYRAAVRRAADRALGPLAARLADDDPEVVAAAAEFAGLTGSPQAGALLAPLLRHPADLVREAALVGLAELGGREAVRCAVPALKDASAAVRRAAARAVAAGGEPAASAALIRRLEQEPDEGVQAELLRAIGRLGAPEALDVLARYAEPGGLLSRGRSPGIRAAAVEGLGRLGRPEARGLVELYCNDKEVAVRNAAEAALR
jgi:HEAT repeat protein